MAGKVLSDQRIAAEPRPAGVSRRALVIGRPVRPKRRGCRALWRCRVRCCWPGPTTSLRRARSGGSSSTTALSIARSVPTAPSPSTTARHAGSSICSPAWLISRSRACLSGRSRPDPEPCPQPLSARPSTCRATRPSSPWRSDRARSKSGARIVPAAGAARLASGDWITFDPSSVAIRGTREEDQIGAWRSGLIVAEREAVAAVVAKIARWQAGRVVIVDPSWGPGWSAEYSILPILGARWKRRSVRSARRCAASRRS